MKTTYAELQTSCPQGGGGLPCEGKALGWDRECFWSLR